MAPERGKTHGYFMEQATREEIPSNGKRSIEIHGRRTSVNIEEAFWTALQKIAEIHHVRPSDLIAAIDKERNHSNLSSAVRLFVLDHYRSKVEGGHTQSSASVPGRETVRAFSSGGG
jgi:predicted DNA-binding ribbon-helix-helix protein